MTTLTLTGILVTRDAAENPISIETATLDLVFATGDPVLNYTVAGQDPGEIPFVSIGGTPVVQATLNGTDVIEAVNGFDISATEDEEPFLPQLGFVQTPGATHEIFTVFYSTLTEEFDAIFQIGGDPLTLPTTFAELDALDASITNVGVAGGALAPGQNIPITSLGGTISGDPFNLVQGTDGNDVLEGTAGDDFINPGDNEGGANGFDVVRASTGNDTIDFGDVVTGFVSVDYLNRVQGPITVNINGVTNQGAVDKGADGLDTFIDVEKPMDAGFTTGGLRISGSAGNDVFNVTVDSDQWMSIRGFDGSDTFNISGAGLVRLNYQREGAINADLTTGVITHDGFADQVNGTIWEIRASDGADTILGSGADESFILRQGNDTLDAGGGIDRLRYDRLGVDGVNADMGTGTVTGIWEGAAFTHTFSNVEWLRGSDGNDRITGSANADRLEGRGGNDTIVGGQGNDFILLGGGADTYVYSGGIDVLGDFEVGIDSIVIDIPGVTQAQVDAAFANPQVVEGATFVDFGVPNGNLNFGALSVADVQTISATVASDAPPETSLFFKIDPTQAGANFSIDALDLSLGDLFTIQLVGDFQAGIDFADDSQNGVTFYDGTPFFSNAQTKATVEFSGTTAVQFQNNDFPIDDNSDPDDDYGLIVEKREPNLTGTEGDDDLASDSASDLLQGFGGNDTISGLSGNDTLLGGDGDDNLFGNDGDDLINPGDNAGGATGFDFVSGSTGNDTIDMSDITNGYVGIGYGGLDRIDVVIDGGTNTGTVDKFASGGAVGTDTLIEVENPLFSGFTIGGLSIRGTVGNDTFDVTPQGNQWMSLRGGAGADSYTINGTGLVRLDFRDANQAIEVNLANSTGQIVNDGFGFTETIGGTSAVWDIQGSGFDDTVTGSGRDESYTAFGGNNTLDGAGGFDRVRYDRETVSSVTIDATAGTATGTLAQGGTFTDTITGFEHLRGSGGDDQITGEAAVDNLYEGQEGTDTFVHLGGNDTIGDFNPNTETLLVRVAGLDQAGFNAAIGAAIDTPAGAQIAFGSGSVTFSGLTTGDLFGANFRFVDASSPVNTVQGTDGDDLLFGTVGDDLIITGDNTGVDTIVPSVGNDTIDFTGITANPGGAVELDYSGGIGAPIIVTIDGAANTGSVVSPGLGTDTFVNVVNPLAAGWTTGGLNIIGSFGNDTFNVAPDGEQWMSIMPGEGIDTLTINGTGEVRIDMSDAFMGIDVNLATRTINNDGFGNTETIGGTGAVWEIRGTFGNDTFVGSDNGESYRYTGGNNTLDGGLGFDRLRYDSSGVASVQIDAANGVVNGTVNGSAFTDSISGFERLRGSFGDDTIIGEAGVDNRYEGRGGADSFVHLGGNDTIGDFNAAEDTLLVRVAGLDQAAVDAAMANATDAPGDVTGSFSQGAQANFGGSTVTFAGLTVADLAGATVQFAPPVGVNVVQGTDGNDFLFGTAGDDLVITGDTDVNGDFYEASTGNDTIDMSGMNQSTAWFVMEYGVLGGPINVQVDGAANTGTIDAGVAGTDTLINPENPLFAGWNVGGLSIQGTASADTFNVAPNGPQWMSIRPGDGVDTIIVGGNGTQRTDPGDQIGALRLQMTDGFGIDVNLATRTIADDGFGNTETIGGTAPVWEVMGSAGNDRFVGSDNAESFRPTGGDDTLDGGAGFDRLRFDAFQITSVSVDADAGTATGTLQGGGTFTSSISGFEHLRGSGGNDQITGEAGVDNRYEGRGGADSFVHLGGNDTIGDFNPLSETLIVRVAGLDQAQVDAAVSGAVAQGGDTLVTFGSGSVLFSGIAPGDLLAADVQFVDPGGASVVEGAAVVDLSTLDGSNGFRIDGGEEFGGFGTSVSSAGDVNGDGFDDVIIGAPFADPGATGKSYVVFGGANPAAMVDLAALDGSNGFRIDGVNELNESGISVSSAGDVNGDGFDDVIIGARGSDSPDPGKSYVVFGGANPAAAVDLFALDGSNGFRIDGGEEFGGFGTSVSSAGDMNGDGFDDVIIGAPFADPGATGKSYVVFGGANPAAVDLTTLDGSTGFRIDGIDEFGGLGRSVSSAGDVNGDGFDDLIIGAPFADPGGKSYVVFGGANPAAVDLTTLDGSNGFRIDGIDEFDDFGLSVSSAGDVNGDGFDDVIIGAPFADPGGKSYVVFGGANPAAVDLTTLDGSTGFRIDGGEEFGGFGTSVSSAGDVNGDGFDDVIIGAPGLQGAIGLSYVVYGSSSPAAMVDLAALDGSNGFRIDPADEFDGAGTSVSAAGDVNGDGFDDLIIGAPFADPGGKSYVVFGKASPDVGTPPPPPPPTPIAWTVGDPHLLTLDGVGYDFHAIGEFVLLRGTADGAFSDFEIQSRMGPVLDSNDQPVPNVSANIAIAAHIGNGSKVMIDAADVSPLSVNGAARQIDDGSSITVDNDQIFRDGDMYTVVFAGADGKVGAGDARLNVIVRDGFVDLSAQISADMAGQVEGLLGDGDGNPDDDIALADGTVLARPLAFEDLYGNDAGTNPNLRDDWRVTTEGQSLFTYDAGETLEGFYDPAAPAGGPADGVSPEALSAAQQAVEGAGLTPGTLAFQNAVQDRLATGDDRFIASSSTEAAPTTQTAGSAGALAQGEERITFDVSLVDRGGAAVDDAVVNFSVAGNAPILGKDADGAGQYGLSLGASSPGGTVNAVRGYDDATDPAIGVSDALNALRLAVGLDPSFGPASAMDFIAADVDRSGQVGVSDALDILRFAVGLETENAPRWVFLDDTQDLNGVGADNVVYESGVETGAPGQLTGPVELTGVLLGSVAEVIPSTVDV